MEIVRTTRKKKIDTVTVIDSILGRKRFGNLCQLSLHSLFLNISSYMWFYILLVNLLSMIYAADHFVADCS